MIEKIRLTRDGQKIELDLDDILWFAEDPFGRGTIVRLEDGEQFVVEEPPDQIARLQQIAKKLF